MTVAVYVYDIEAGKKAAGRGASACGAEQGIAGGAVASGVWRRRLRVVGLAMMFCCLPFLLSAQTARKKEPDTIPGRERWAVKTNALEWLLTIPNIGVEFDLSRSIYNRMTVGLTAKWNWNTSHNYKPAVVFNVFEVRPEFRYYWRTTLKQPRGDDDTTRRSLKQWLKEEVLTTGRVDPKYWRAYYIGGYVHGGKYSFKFGKEGRQGQMYGLGFTMGYGLPLYSYKSGSIDIELGASLGIELTKYDVFTHNPDGNYYTKVESKSRGLHVVPYPVISELKVGFVYRVNSISNKYKRVDYVKQELKRQKREEAQLRRDSVQMRRDSARMAREAAVGADSTGRGSFLGGLFRKRQQPAEVTGEGTATAAPDSTATEPKRGFFRKRDKEAEPSDEAVTKAQAGEDGGQGDAAVEQEKKTSKRNLFKKRDKAGDDADAVKEEERAGEAKQGGTEEKKRGGLRSLFKGKEKGGDA